MSYDLNYDVIWRSSDLLLAGLFLGLAMAVASLFLGCIIGILSAYARVAGPKWLSILTISWVEIVRNTPLLLLVFIVYFGFPALGIRVLDNIASFVLALSVYAGAYFSEVFRAGLGSIPRAYVDGAKAIGLTVWQRQRYVILPVTFRYVLPALGTNFISLFKDTSIAAAIAIPELTYQARAINTNTFRVIEAWTAASALYLATCLCLAFVFRQLERRFAAVR